MKYTFAFLTLLFFAYGCGSPQPTDELVDNQDSTQIEVPQSAGSVLDSLADCEIGEFWDEYDVTGVFIIEDELNGKTIRQNYKLADSMFSPASTFKICNSLIALETGAVSSEKEVLVWDGIDRGHSPWNRNTDMELAFKNSTVWFYQEIATRVGLDTMQTYLTKLKYGNANPGGGLTQFWLNGGDLRISPQQQIDFLKRLKHNELPLKKSTMETVKRIMQYDVTQHYNMRGKTGWSELDGNDMGWFVGYVEADGNTYYFANLVFAKGMEIPGFAKSRVEVVYKVFHKLGIIQ